MKIVKVICSSWGKSSSIASLFCRPSEVAEAIVSLIEEGPNGGVMVVEPGKDPYYVEAPVPS